eukprot:gene1854-2188_t
MVCKVGSHWAAWREIFMYCKGLAAAAHRPTASQNQNQCQGRIPLRQHKGLFASLALVAVGLGQHDGVVGDSHEISLNKGRVELSAMIDHFVIRPQQDCLEAAHRLYRLAVQAGFTKGRLVPQVAACCLYIICRQEDKPFMLIDLSDMLQVNVYKLGAVYLQLAKLLRLEDHPSLTRPIDPSLYIHRFMDKLDVPQNMEARWYLWGCTVDGLSPAWAGKDQDRRVREFTKNAASGLTITEFQQASEQHEQDTAQILAQLVSSATSWHFLKTSGGVWGVAADPPAFKPSQQTITYGEGEESEILMLPAPPGHGTEEEIQVDDEDANEDEEADDEERDVSDEEDSSVFTDLAAVDDDEIASYIMPEAEVKVKEKARQAAQEDLERTAAAAEAVARENAEAWSSAAKAALGGPAAAAGGPEGVGEAAAEGDEEMQDAVWVVGGGGGSLWLWELVVVVGVGGGGGGSTQKRAAALPEAETVEAAARANVESNRHLSSKIDYKNLQQMLDDIQGTGDADGDDNEA